ncbi:DNA alkylation repair enzyme [uncultured archaeon]|nr:DNA alkylation repair enzyme [uncultured archaeon]
MKCDEVLRRLRMLSNPKNVAGMERFGINPEGTLGVSMVEVRKLAKQVGRDHVLALELWASGVHEARILAALVDVPGEVSLGQMEGWVVEFDSWDVCDQVVMNLFDRTPYAYDKAMEWSGRREEFVKRAGFALMASLAVHDKKAGDEKFLRFLPLIKKGATDERNFVRKAVNWALRQIGKRNLTLNKKAVETAKEIQKLDSKAARWVASDALKELSGEAVQAKLKAKPRLK